jgi:5-methylcytosine-specific restriction protein A
MPLAPPISCSTPLCSGRRQAGTACPVCGRGGKRASRREYDQHRGSAAERGYDNRWRRARLTFLASHPLCSGPHSQCEQAGIVSAATVVDHVVPHRGDEQLFWDESNWAALCERCHNVKTAQGL